METLTRNGLEIYISLARKFLYKKDMNKSVLVNVFKVNYPLIHRLVF